MKRFTVYIGLALLLCLGTAQAQEMRDHYYVVKSGFEYGYEVAGSNEVLLAKYLGQKSGVYQALITEGKHRTVIESKAGSKFATVYQYKGDKFIKRSMLKLDDKAIAGQIMLDAWNSRLSQYKGNKGTLWLDGENGPVWNSDK